MARNERKERNDRNTDVIEKLVSINRVAKTVKGGRNMSFAAFVVVGDGKGRVGYGKANAKEVAPAIQKATEIAKKSMMRVPLREGRTLHHDTMGKYGAGEVLMRSAPAGTGIIAGGPVRAIFEALGVQDVVAKSNGSSNPYNMVKAVFAGFDKMTSPRSVAARRGIKVSEVLGKDAKDAEVASAESEE